MIEHRLHPSPYIVIDAETFFIRSRFDKGRHLVDPYIATAIAELSKDYNFICWVQKEERSLLDRLKPAPKKPDYSSLGTVIETTIDEIPALLEENVSPFVYFRRWSDPRINELLIGTEYRLVPMMRKARTMATIIEHYKYMEKSKFEEQGLTHAAHFRDAIATSKYVKSSGKKLLDRLEDLG